MLDWIRSFFPGDDNPQVPGVKKQFDWHRALEDAKNMRDLLSAEPQQQPDFMSNNVPGQAVPPWERKSKLREIMLPSQRY